MQTMRTAVCGSRSRATLMAAAIVTSFAGCGGGVTDDSHGAAAHLTCAKQCTPSSSLKTEQIRPSFAIVGNGQKVQAQAGFNTGNDPRFNVELDGDDELRLVTPQGTQKFHIPASSIETVVVDALKTLLIGATPYLSEVTPAQGTMPVQFQLVRGTTVYTSAVTLPAPFQITAPVAGAVLPLTTRTLSVRLTSTSATADIANAATLNCTDVNGNTASGQPALAVVQGSQATDVNGTAYVLDLGTALDGLSFTTTHPRGAVAACDVNLGVTVEVNGQADAAFNNPRVFAQQIRSVRLTLR